MSVLLKKTRLPKANKTQRHNCSQCPRTDAKRYPISEKEVRWLCIECVIKFQNQHEKGAKPHFIKASKLFREY